MKQLLSFLLVLVSVVATGQSILPRPNPPRLVNDFTNTLSGSQQAELESKLVAFDNQTSNQIAVVLINSTDGYDISDVALKYLRDWGVGNKKNNNGAVMLVAVADRKIFIATGYGLEGALPDITAGQIIRGNITPQFKKGDYYQGISDGIDAIIQATKGEYKAPAGYANRGRKGKGGSPLVFIIAFIIIIFLISRGGRGGGGGMMSRRGYGGFGSGFLWGSMFGGGFSGGGSSSGGGSWGGGGGGGFGGFGGGSGGGGGAGGSW